MFVCVLMCVYVCMCLCIRAFLTHLEVAVDDGRHVGVQVGEPPKDLAAPPLDDLPPYHLR